MRAALKARMYLRLMEYRIGTRRTIDKGPIAAYAKTTLSRGAGHSVSVLAVSREAQTHVRPSYEAPADLVQ